ncbi:hypothetical protein C8F04DRAFT_1192944 [Mycena alexandri]|uniref:Uncharacterized protein n=1 Tax=Mycena alexandri TaxID=1745969 RepID=A0AAD6WR03_9AGAR|nr:hypothetical protein C8F04DRAFT_1192944 [Mycena alexandri]
MRLSSLSFASSPNLTAHELINEMHIWIGSKNSRNPPHNLLIPCQYRAPNRLIQSKFLRLADLIAGFFKAWSGVNHHIQFDREILVSALNHAVEQTISISDSNQQKSLQKFPRVTDLFCSPEGLGAEWSASAMIVLSLLSNNTSRSHCDTDCGSGEISLLRKLYQDSRAQPAMVTTTPPKGSNVKLDLTCGWWLRTDATKYQEHHPRSLWCLKLLDGLVTTAVIKYSNNIMKVFGVTWVYNRPEGGEPLLAIITIPGQDKQSAAPLDALSRHACRRTDPILRQFPSANGKRESGRPIPSPRLWGARTPMTSIKPAAADDGNEQILEKKTHVLAESASVLLKDEAIGSSHPSPPEQGLSCTITLSFFDGFLSSHGHLAGKIMLSNDPRATIEADVKIKILFVASIE